MLQSITADECDLFTVDRETLEVGRVFSAAAERSSLPTERRRGSELGIQHFKKIDILALTLGAHKHRRPSTLKAANATQWDCSNSLLISARSPLRHRSRGCSTCGRLQWCGTFTKERADLSEPAVRRHKPDSARTLLVDNAIHPGNYDDGRRTRCALMWLHEN